MKHGHNVLLKITKVQTILQAILHQNMIIRLYTLKNVVNMNEGKNGPKTNPCGKSALTICHFEDRPLKINL